MLHSCRNTLFYCSLFNSSLNSLEFKFELNCLNPFLKNRNLSFSFLSFGPAQFPLIRPSTPSPFSLSLFSSPRSPVQLARFPLPAQLRASPLLLSLPCGDPPVRAFPYPAMNGLPRSPAAARLPALSWPARLGAARPYISRAPRPSLGPLRAAAAATAPNPSSRAAIVELGAPRRAAVPSPRSFALRWICSPTPPSSFSCLPSRAIVRRRRRFAPRRRACPPPRLRPEPTL